MATEAPSTKKKSQTEAAMDAISSRKAHRDQHVQGLPDTPFEAFDRIYTQKPLSAIPRLELIRIISEALNKTISTQDAGLVSFIAELRAGSNDESGAAGVIMQLITRLGMTSTTAIPEIMMLSLGVPSYERDLVEGVWQQQEDPSGRGGLSDDDLEAILETFVDQNAQSLVDFFGKRIPKLVARVREILSPTSDS